MRRSDFVVLPFGMDLAVAMSQLMVNLRALDLGASAALVGVLLGLCWGVPYTLTCFAAGLLVGRFGARRLMLAGAALFGTGIALYGVALAPWVLLAAAPLSGIGCALFWPSIQTYLHLPDHQETRRRTGIFNVSWTLGILLGSGIGGHAYDALGEHGAFFAVAGLVAAIIVAMTLRVGAPAAMTEAEEEAHAASVGTPPAARIVHLRMAWIANFALGFAGSLATSIFPRLARSLGIADGAIGEVAAVVWLGQSGMFALLAATRGWHYRSWPVLAALCGGAAAIALLGVGTGSLVFAAAFVLLGASRSPTHMASIKYGLEAGPSREANMGYHEAILGCGFVLGPLAAGVVAGEWGLRAPFWLACSVLGLASVGVIARHRAGRACLRPEPEGVAPGVAQR